MGKWLLMILLFSLLALLLAGQYGIIPSPWLEEGAKTLATRDSFVNKSVRVMDRDEAR